jgi:hypothetical protein
MKKPIAIKIKSLDGHTGISISDRNDVGIATIEVKIQMDYATWIKYQWNELSIKDLKEIIKSRV